MIDGPGPIGPGALRRDGEMEIGTATYRGIRRAAPGNPRTEAPAGTACATLGCGRDATHRGYDRLYNAAWLCDMDSRGNAR